MPQEIVQMRTVLLQSRTAYPRTGSSGPSQRSHHSSIESTSSVLRVALPTLSGSVMTNGTSKCKQRVSLLTQSSGRTQALPFLPYLPTPLTAFALEDANPVRNKYDAMLPVSVRDQLSHVDSTEYDALGRITRHFGYASSTLATTARYDLDSRPTSTTNRRGQRIDLTYDALGRLLSKAGGNNETSTDTFTYATNGLVQTAANATDSVRTVSVPLSLLDTVQTTI